MATITELPRVWYLPEGKCEEHLLNEAELMDVIAEEGYEETLGTMDYEEALDLVRSKGFGAYRDALCYSVAELKQQRYHNIIERAERLGFDKTELDILQTALFDGDDDPGLSYRRAWQALEDGEVLRAHPEWNQAAIETVYTWLVELEEARHYLGLPDTYEED